MKQLQLSIDEPGDFWLFAYGSLMWNPGFPFKKTQKATLKGWQRKFCISSESYRGTIDNPGLSLGLDLGGECQGLAFFISGRDRDFVLDYLSKRELKEQVYHFLPVIINVRGLRLKAYTLVVNHDHRLYVGQMSMPQIAKRIAYANGANGSNMCYLKETVKHLELLGVKDEMLTTLSMLVDQCRK